MRVYTRTNAIVGWAMIELKKRRIKRVMKESLIPSVDPKTRKPNTSAIALVAASIVGAASFWRARADHASSVADLDDGNDSDDLDRG